MLCYPHCLSLTDQFDRLGFVLKFPSVDDIVPEICSQGDNFTIANLDVARAFRIFTWTKLTPSNWDDDFFIDVVVAFGWVQGSALF